MCDFISPVSFDLTVAAFCVISERERDKHTDREDKTKQMIRMKHRSSVGNAVRFTTSMPRGRV